MATFPVKSYTYSAIINFINVKHKEIQKLFLCKATEKTFLKSFRSQEGGGLLDMR